jgi:hypothetical protein
VDEELSASNTGMFGTGGNSDPVTYHTEAHAATAGAKQRESKVPTVDEILDEHDTTMGGLNGCGDGLVERTLSAGIATLDSDWPDEALGAIEGDGNNTHVLVVSNANGDRLDANGGDLLDRACGGMKLTVGVMLVRPRLPPAATATNPA